MVKRKTRRIVATEHEFKVVDLDLSHLAYLVTAHDLREPVSQEPSPSALTAKEQITCDRMISNAMDKVWLALYGKKQ